jgi:hypothetical protein
MSISIKNGVMTKIVNGVTRYAFFFDDTQLPVLVKGLGKLPGEEMLATFNDLQGQIAALRQATAPQPATPELTMEQKIAIATELGYRRSEPDASGAA